MKKLFYFALPLVMFILFMMHSTTFAQPNDRREEVMKILRQKFIDKVQVDEATADKFFELYKENQKSMGDLNKQKREVMKYIEANPDAADIESKTDELINLETRTLDQRKKFYNDAKLILTPKQLAQSIVLQNNFKKFIREELKGRRKGDKDKRDRKSKRD